MEKLAINGGIPVRETKIYYGKQWIDENDIYAVDEVLRSDYVTCGPKTQELERSLEQYTGARHAVAVSNGTAALHCACMAAGIGAGDEVITTPLTFAASANCALYCGAKPVFADVEEDTYNIDPKSIEDKITDKTKAVVAVDFTGQAVKHREIREICDRHHLIFIEDAAHAIATTYNGVQVGNLADITTFSFHPVKTITGGEGGAVLTNSDELYQKPFHPYTKALMAAIPIPDPDTEEQKKRIRLEGEIPSPVNPKPGCRFVTRCRYATEKCHQETPKLEELAPEHFVACHRAKELMEDHPQE